MYVKLALHRQPRQDECRVAPYALNPLAVFEQEY